MNIQLLDKTADMHMTQLLNNNCQEINQKLTH